MNVQLVRAELTAIYIKVEEKKNYIAALEKRIQKRIMVICMSVFSR